MGNESLFLEVVDDRIEAYREHWLVRDSEVAQLCWDFEESLAGYVELFWMICGINSAWRENVFTGAREYPDCMANAVKSLYASWIANDHLVEDLVSFFESQGYDGEIKGVPKYRECLRIAHLTLKHWKTPTPSPAVADHRVSLDKEQSKKFRELLAGVR